MEREAATEEGMARVGDLDLGHVVIGWVVEAGIQVRGRSTPSTMGSC